MNTLKLTKNMTMTKKDLFDVAFVVLFLAFSLIYFMFSRDIFPSYFFNDNATIRNYMNNISINSDKNYVSTAKFFLMFRFNANTSFDAEAFFAWTVFAILMLVLILKFKIDFLKMRNLSLLLLFTLFYGAYSAQFSKELVIFIMLDAVLLISPLKFLNKTFTIFVILYGIYFRTYWILIYVCSIIFFYIFNFSKLNKLVKLLLYFVTIICMEVGYNLITGGFLSDARYTVNSFRIEDLYTNTIINNPLINNSIFTDFWNFLYGLINVFIPIDGIHSANEIVYYIWIWIIVFLCWKYLKNNQEHKDYKLFFVLAMITIQAFFEPDVGSMLRHQIILIPILLLMLNENNVKNVSPKDKKDGIIYE